MTGDLVEQYLARLRARLRAPAEHAEQILAEAEDHLRESVAAGVAIGMTEQEAQEAAISAFGPVRAVVRAHWRPAGAAAEVAMAVWKLVGIYLLTVPAVGLGLLILFYPILQIRTAVPLPASGSPPHTVLTDGPPDAVSLVAGLSASAIAGLALLIGYGHVRRSRRHRRPAPLGGFFPLAAAVFMLCAGPVAAAAMIKGHLYPVGGSGLLGAAAVAGSPMVALGYAAAMGMTIVRQRRDGETTQTEVRHAR